jgi:hypothetical protein
MEVTHNMSDNEPEGGTAHRKEDNAARHAQAEDQFYGQSSHYQGTGPHDVENIMKSPEPKVEEVTIKIQPTAKPIGAR